MLIDFEPCFKQFKNQKRILASGLSFRSKKLFDKQFNSDVSQKKLIEIIKTSITGKE